MPFPTLLEMGINRPEDVVRYTLTQRGEEDVLEITFNRPPGSLLPRSKSYHFAKCHSDQMSEVSGKASKKEDPLLLSAVAELNSLTKGELDQEQYYRLARAQVDGLQQIIAQRMKVIREQLARAMK